MKTTFIVFTALFFSLQLSAQRHEYGGWLGTAQYYGDLNTSLGINTPQPAGGVYYKKVIGPYLQARAGVNFARLAGDDAKSSKPFQQRRNLSFRSNVFELAANVDFHFKRFEPRSKQFKSTPYLSLGLALSYFNPKAKFNEEWLSLRDLGTEGQQIGDITGRQPYSLIQPAIPVGLGYKQYIGNDITIGIEAGYRFVFTDYLDDVSTTYVSPNVLGVGTTAELLADRSGEVGEEIGYAGNQRGNSVDQDAYLFFGINITKTIFKTYCP